MNFPLMMNTESPSHINNGFDFQQNANPFHEEPILGTSPVPSPHATATLIPRNISPENQLIDPNPMFSRPLANNNSNLMVEESKVPTIQTQNDNPEVRSWFIFKTNQLKELITTHLCTSKKKEEEEQYFDSGLMMSAINSTHNPDKRVLFEMLFSFFKNALRSLELKCAKKKKFIQDLKKFGQKLEKDKNDFFNPHIAQTKAVKKNDEKYERKKLKKVKDLDPTYQDQSFEPSELTPAVNQTHMPAPIQHETPIIPEKPMSLVTEPDTQTLNMQMTAEPTTTSMVDYGNEYEGPSSIAHTRARRNVKKPVYTYENKIVEEKQKSARKFNKRDRLKPEPPNWKPPADSKSAISREDLSNSWRDWELHFHNLISTLTQEEFILVIQKIMANYPDCVSFENGYLELTVNAEKIQPPLGRREDSRSNQMRNQLQTYQIFTQYINEIKEQRRKKQEEKVEEKAEKVESNLEMKSEMKSEIKSEIKSEAPFENYPEQEMNPGMLDIKAEEQYEVGDDFHIPFIMDDNNLSQHHNDFQDFNFS